MTARKNPKKTTREPLEIAYPCVDATRTEGVQTLTEEPGGPPNPQESPQTPIEEPVDQTIVEGEFEEVNKTAYDEMIQVPQDHQIPLIPQTPQAPLEEIQPEIVGPIEAVELVAYCPHCGKGVKSSNWNTVASWFGEHCQRTHPEVFSHLFSVASAFLGLMIADTYDTKPEWGDQPSMEVLRGELMDIIEGGRDPLEDGLS